MHNETHSTHTPAPWVCEGRTTMYLTPDESDEITMIEVQANVTDAGWDTVAFIEATWPCSEANARRMCAAVNACEGISTEALEDGVIAKTQEVLTYVAKMLTDFKPDYLRQIGLDTALEQVEAALAMLVPLAAGECTTASSRRPA